MSLRHELPVGIFYQHIFIIIFLKFGINNPEGFKKITLIRHIIIILMIIIIIKGNS